jgi:hypothetical protein
MRRVLDADPIQPNQLTVRREHSRDRTLNVQQRDHVYFQGLDPALVHAHDSRLVSSGDASTMPTVW